MSVRPNSSSAHSGDDDDGGHQEALHAIARGGGANAGGALLAGTASFLLTVLIARWWSLEEAGLLFAATSVFLMAVGLCHLGVDQSIVRFLAWNLGSGTPAGNRRLTTWALVPVMALSMVVATIGWFGAEPLGRAFGVTGSGGDSVTVVRILAVTLPIAVLYEQLLSITRGYSRMRATVVLERILRPSLQLLFVIGAANLAPTIATLALAWVAPYVICVALAAVAVRATIHTMSRDAHGAQVEPGALSDFWRFTAPRGVARLSQIGLQRADIVIISFLAGPAAAAIYTAATRFLVLGQMATSALQQVSEPQLARLLGANNLRGAATVVRQMTLWSTALAVPLYLSLAVHSETLLRLIFGSEFVAGSGLLRLLCGAMMIGVCCGPVDVLLLMAGRSTLSLINTTAALGIDVLLCFLLVPPLSYLGAGIAWATAILVKNGLACVQVWRHLRVVAFTWRQARWAAVLLLPFGLAPLIVSIAVASVWIPLAVSVVLGLCYLAWLWTYRSRLLSGT